MLRVHKTAIAALLGAALMAVPAAFAQDHHPDNGRYVHHAEWRKGYHLPQADWGRGDHVANWQQYRLRRPPNGYEWRRIDGNFVLAAVNTGIVETVVVAR